MLFCLDKYKNRDDIEIVAVLTKNDTFINSWQRSLGWICKKEGIKIVSLEDVYDIANLLFLSLEFDRIIRTKRFKSEQLFNVHFSLLPKYKGMYPCVLPILNGENKTGVTLHKIRDGIDTGEIIEQRSFVIDDGDSSLDVYKRLNKVGTLLITSNIDRLLYNDYECIAQSSENSTYYSSDFIDYGNLKLRYRQTAYQIKKQVLAFAFRPYQLLTYEGHALIDARITDEVSDKEPGTIVEESDTYIKISTIDYNLILYKDVLEKLMVCIRDNMNKQAVALCVSQKIFNDCNEQGWSPLTVAVHCNNYYMVRFLIEKGSDINITSTDGVNLLMYAAECFNKYNDITIFQYLLDTGLSPLNRDYYGRTLKDYCREKQLLLKGSKSDGCKKL